MLAQVFFEFIQAGDAAILFLQYRISCYELSIGGSVFHRCAS